MKTTWLMVAVLASCAGAIGPEGPQGPAGPEGPMGTMGVMGTPGPADVERLALPGPAFYPENLSAAADGTLYVGSVATGAVVAFAPGSATATTFLAAGTVKGVAGVLVDEQTHSLLICAIDPMFQSATTVQRFDLATKARLATFSFTGSVFPNDLAFDAAHRLYVTDSFSGKIFRLENLTADATFTEWASDALLAPVHMGAFGADGITFDGAGNLFVNNNDTGKLVRVPIQASGAAGAASEVVLSPALAHPDGQRQLSANELVVVDNAGTLSRVTLTGATGTVTPIANHLDAPTGVALVGGFFWVSEGQLTTSLLVGMPANLPFSVRRIAAYASSL